MADEKDLAEDGLLSRRAIKWSTYKAYIKALGGIKVFCFIFFIFFIPVVVVFVDDVWLSLYLQTGCNNDFGSNAIGDFALPNISDLNFGDLKDSLSTKYKKSHLTTHSVFEIFSSNRNSRRKSNETVKTETSQLMKYVSHTTEYIKIKVTKRIDQETPDLTRNHQPFHVYITSTTASNQTTNNYIPKQINYSKLSNKNVSNQKYSQNNLKNRNLKENYIVRNLAHLFYDCDTVPSPQTFLIIYVSIALSIVFFLTLRSVIFVKVF